MSFLRDHADETENPAAVRVKANDIAHAKSRDHEIELTQIQNLLRKTLSDAKAQYEREQVEYDPALKRRIANQEFSAKLWEIAEEVNALEGTEEEKLDRLTDRVVEEIQAKTGLPGWVAKLLKPVYKRIIQSTGSTGPAETADTFSEAVK